MEGALTEFRTSTRGFTLIEIAIVVAIVMTLLTLGLGLVNAQLSSAAVSVTKKRQEAIKDALIAYLGSYKRLPCPDIPNYTHATSDSSGITGEEDRQGGTPVGGCITPAGGTAPYGVVPFRTLGLSRDTATDGWSNFFSYQVHAFSGSTTCPGTTSDWSKTDCFGTGKSGGISVIDSSTLLTADGIAVLVSHGADGLGAWAAQSTQNVIPATTSLSTCEERKNLNLGGCTYTTPTGTTAQYYFKGERQDQDDVVSWIDGKEAITALSKQGLVKISVAQLNEALQGLHDSKLGTLLSAVSSSGSPPATIGCPAALALQNLNDMNGFPDPWGNQYTYEQKGPNGFPIEICSMGCASCTPVVSASCKSIDKNTFNGYLGKYFPPPLCP